MPTYDYVCTKCGHEFEIFQSMKDATLKTCPRCKKPALKRLIGGGAGLIFKGSGFYITDYKNKSPKKDGTDKPSSGGSDKPPSGATDKPSSGGAEKKPTPPPASK